MKNRSLEAIKSKVKISIKGKNVNRYLLKLARNHISILHSEKIDAQEYFIIIYYKDYEKVKKLNTIYDISVIEYGGFLKKKRQFHQQKWVIVMLLFALLFLILLSHMIFEIEIVTNDKTFRNQLLQELKQYDIDKFHFQKSYQQLQEIKEKLLEIHHEDIEWLEIESIGTKYRVRFEPRIVEPEKEETPYRHVIAKKNAILKKIEGSHGQVVQDLNTYVKKGDVIISGYLSLNGQVKDTISAEGTIYGETWYEVEVFYPFGYYERTKTGREKDVYVVEFLSHRIELFNFHPFYDKITTREILLEKKGFPLRLVKEHQEEAHTISSIETADGAMVSAIELAVSKVNHLLGEKEEVLNYKVIHRKLETDGVRLVIFFSVYEDITDYEEITPYVEEKNEEDNI